jgi:hypothetical protein
MNLKLEDISHYLVLIIFVLIILKVIGPGIQSYFVEFFTGKKEEEDFSLDELISKKKNQFALMGANVSKEKPLLLRIKESNNPKKEELQKLLNSLQWGVPEESYISSTIELLGEVSHNKGMSQLLSPIFEKEEDLENKNLLEIWVKKYDSLILWLNLYNCAKDNVSIKEVDQKYSLLSLISFKEEVKTIEENYLNLEAQELIEKLDSFAQETSFYELNIISLKSKEIFEKWHKNALIFKSLQEKSPKS